LKKKKSGSVYGTKPNFKTNLRIIDFKQIKLKLTVALAEL